MNEINEFIASAGTAASFEQFVKYMNNGGRFHAD